MIVLQILLKSFFKTFLPKALAINTCTDLLLGNLTNGS
jgi:hypothetical protein